MHHLGWQPNLLSSTMTSVHKIPYLPLYGLRLAPATLRAYNKQLSSFLIHSRLKLEQLFTIDVNLLDLKLAKYIQHSYDHGTPFTYAAHTLHAITFHRPSIDAHRQLPYSVGCIRAWDRVKKTNSHPPLTWELTVLIACTMSRSGYHAPAIGMLVAFDCYLRVGELTRLRRCDIVMPSDSRMGNVNHEMVVCLPKTKTGVNQSVEVGLVVRSTLELWIKTLGLTQDSDSTSLIFNFTPNYFRRLLSSTCQSLGITTHYVPHSLRHGGATHDYLRTKDIGYVQFRGRWKSMESARRYIQQCRAVLASHQVSPELHQLGTIFNDSLLDVFSATLNTIPSIDQPRRRVTFRL
jgi:integrase